MLRKRLWCVAVALVAVVPIQTAASATAQPGEQNWDPTLPRTVSAGAPGDPVALANSGPRNRVFSSIPAMPWMAASKGRAAANSDGDVVCHERLGGLLKYYSRKAA